MKPHIKWLANCERVQASIKLSPMFLSQHVVAKTLDPDPASKQYPT